MRRRQGLRRCCASSHAARGCSRRFAGRRAASRLGGCIQRACCAERRSRRRSRCACHARASHAAPAPGPTAQRVRGVSPRAAGTVAARRYSRESVRLRVACSARAGSAAPALNALVETALLAACTGLAYHLSSAFRLEAYLGAFFPLPTVLASARWSDAAAWKTMVRAARKSWPRQVRCAADAGGTACRWPPRCCCCCWVGRCARARSCCCTVCGWRACAAPRVPGCRPARAHVHRLLPQARSASRLA